jgi:hypothetical protein
MPVKWFIFISLSAVVWLFVCILQIVGCHIAWETVFIVQAFVAFMAFIGLNPDL